MENTPASSQAALLSEENPNPICELHVTGAIAYMNPAAQTMFPDLPSLGLRHQLLEGLSDIINALRDNGVPSVRRELRAGGNAYDQQFTMAKGSEFIRIWMNDITHRKRTEAKLQMANTTLVKLLGDLQQSHRHLQSVQSQLIQAEKMSALGQMASGIAHELKNPLGNVLHGVTYLEQELGPHRGEHAEIVKLMKEAVRQADTIVRGLLDFARPAPLELKPTAINQVVKAALELAGMQHAGRQVKIITHLGPSLQPVMIDENQMKQALINLIVNACQAMPDGGTLTILTLTKALSKKGSRVGGHAAERFRPGQRVLVCEIGDTGSGIPAPLLSKIFDPFFTTKPPGCGTGLGLSITKTIIEAHRGLVEITSKEGVGTKATITLPVFRAPRVPPTTG